MAYSSVSYSANSSANSGKDYTYSFPAVVHDTANILITVGGSVLATTRYTVASAGGTITLEAVPGAGTAPLDAALSASNTLKVYRLTNRTSAEVVFSSGAVIQDEDLNTATDQGRYLALEAVDRANESIAIDEADASRYNVQIDGADKRIYGVATPTNDKDAVNKAYADANVAAAAGSAGDASDSADDAEDWAIKVDGAVSGSDFSAKAHASVEGANAPAEGSAKEWAVTATDTPITTGPNTYSALHHSAKAALEVGLAASQVTLATDQKTLALASQEAAANSAAAVAAIFDNFDDTYLGTMADLVSADTGALTGASWNAGSSSIAFTGTTGTISIGQELTSTGSGYPVGANIIGSGVTTPLIISAPFTSAGSGTLNFVGSGVYGAWNVAKDGPAFDNDGDALATGMLYFNSTDNEMRIYDGGNWIAASAAGTASLTTYKFVATADQTTFTGTETQAPSASLSYTVLNLIVFLNGVRLDAADYTATNGTSIVLGSGAALSDELVVVAFKSFSVTTVEGTSIKSTGEADETKFLRVDGAGASWQPVPAATGTAIAMAIIFG